MTKQEVAEELNDRRAETVQYLMDYLRSRREGLEGETASIEVMAQAGALIFLAKLMTAGFSASDRLSCEGAAILAARESVRRADAEREEAESASPIIYQG